MLLCHKKHYTAGCCIRLHTPASVNDRYDIHARGKNTLPTSAVLSRLVDEHRRSPHAYSSAKRMANSVYTPHINGDTHLAITIVILTLTCEYSQTRTHADALTHALAPNNQPITTILLFCALHPATRKHTEYITKQHPQTRLR